MAATGLLAVGLAAWQLLAAEDDLQAWAVLAVVSAAMIGTEAIVRARRMHGAFADRLLSVTLQRFLPALVAGAVIGGVILTHAPEHSRLLPGLWQMLIGVGLFSVLGSLLRQMIVAAVFYFGAGAISLLLSSNVAVANAAMMGGAFGAGQLLVAAILWFAARENDRA